MILVAGGDSFTFGSELKDQIYSPSNCTFPALLAKKNSLEYNCIAVPGNANGAITRQTIATCENYLQLKKTIAVIITWSFFNRYEFRFNYHTGHKYSPWYSINSWSAEDNFTKIQKEFKKFDNHILLNQQKHFLIEQKTGLSSFAKCWFEHVGDNEYYELWSSLKEILFLQMYLEQKNIPYLFLPADNHFFQHPNYFRQKDEYIDALYNQINWNKWFFFESSTKFNETIEPRGFYQWAVENKYPIGATHPLEEAHAVAAELLEEKFNELVTKPLEQSSIGNTL